MAEDGNQLEVESVKEFVFHDLEKLLTKIGQQNQTTAESDVLLFKQTQMLLRQMRKLSTQERTAALHQFLRVKSTQIRTKSETYPPAWVGISLVEAVFHSNMSVQPKYTREKMTQIRAFVEAQLPDNLLPSIDRVMKEVEDQPHLDPFCLITGALAEIKTNEAQRLLAYHLYVLILTRKAKFKVGFHALRLREIVSAMIDPAWSMGQKQRVWLESYLAEGALLSDLSSPSPLPDSYVYKINPRMGPNQMAGDLLEDFQNFRFFAIFNVQNGKKCILK